MFLNVPRWWMLWAECLFGLLGPAKSCRRQRALAAGAQVAQHGIEREQSCFTFRERDKLVGGVNKWLLPNQSFCASISTSSVFSPIGFFSFCGVSNGFSSKSLQGGQDWRWGRNWEYICCNFSITGGICSSADGSLSTCAQAPRCSLYFLYITSCLSQDLCPIVR